MPKAIEMIEENSRPRFRRPSQNKPKLAQTNPQGPEPSWYCDQCQIEVYERRCPHCGKTWKEKR